MTFEEFARLTRPRTTPDTPLTQQGGHPPLPRRKPTAQQDRHEPISRGPRGVGTVLPGLGWAIGD
ncbi:hypothetical protein PWG71_28620 [Nocardiopsis sp. N85]|uniref:hypothetical protein n=1 Tax=Nocardiopsis sp. N85 TaxID=3029400 RepID=UPI00237F33E6|nr:hypothetical protein [Nocardiopsis sp. N85]MDE3725358.1 hypothetical protein [Nocardiopsis sp. N85]